jgi:hypothetical protein
MRVEFNSVFDFCEELKDSEILDNVVRLRVDKIAQQAEAVTFEYRIRATAVQVTSSGERFLLGLEIVTEDESEADGMSSGLEAAADAGGFKLKGGNIELY